MLYGRAGASKSRKSEIDLKPNCKKNASQNTRQKKAHKVVMTKFNHWNNKKDGKEQNILHTHNKCLIQVGLNVARSRFSVVQWVTVTFTVIVVQETKRRLRRDGRFSFFNLKTEKSKLSICFICRSVMQTISSKVCFNSPIHCKSDEFAQRKKDYANP